MEYLYNYQRFGCNHWCENTHLSRRSETPSGSRLRRDFNRLLNLRKYQRKMPLYRF